MNMLTTQDTQNVTRFNNGSGQGLQINGDAAQRSMSEIQSQMVIAKQFPRDEIAASSKVKNECSRMIVAEQAVFSFPRGGKQVKGASIRLAEAIAKAYGNIKYGFRELRSEDGGALVEAFAWDLESNTYVTRQFNVLFKIKAQGSIKSVTDPREQYELVASYAQRRVRACILEVLPADIVENAMQWCNDTLSSKGKNEPLVDRIKKLVMAFESTGVSIDMLEKRLKHSIDLMSHDEVNDYRSIYASLKEGECKRSEYFDFETKEVKTEAVTTENKQKAQEKANELNDTLDMLIELGSKVASKQ